MSQTKSQIPSLDKEAENLQKGVNQIINFLPGAKKIKNFLNGVWLGHALHPLLTDLPLGSWTVAALLDVLSLGREKSRFAAGADASIGLGILGAFGAAASGLADWSEIDGKEREVGFKHMLLNSVALTAYIASWLLRRAGGQGKRGVAVAISTLGFTAVGASAYLGGELVYKYGIMVNSNIRYQELNDWTEVMKSEDLAENSPHKVVTNNVPIVLIRQANKVYALGDNCSHLSGPLSEGQLEDDTIVCPWHGSRFCLKDGQVIDGPAVYPQPVYKVREKDGKLQVKFDKQ
jgi:nitrite reductase/ring-hydroxylating ferredoxin subunit/uncharacterized membrane protein